MHVDIIAPSAAEAEVEYCKNDDPSLVKITPHFNKRGVTAVVAYLDIVGDSGRKVSGRLVVSGNSGKIEFQTVNDENVKQPFDDPPATEQKKSPPAPTQSRTASQSTTSKSSSNKT